MNLIIALFLATVVSAATHEPVQPDENGVYAYMGDYPALVYKDGMWCE